MKEAVIPNLKEVSAEAGDDIGSAFVDEIARSRDEVLELHGKGDADFYEKLGRDDKVYPCLLQRRSMVIARELKVDAGGDAPIDIEAADFIREQMSSIAWDRTTMKMLTKMLPGYGVAECLFTLKGAVGERPMVHIDRVKVRRSSRFRFANDGSLRLVREGEPRRVPNRKFWVVTFGAEDDDDLYGRGLGHWLYWPVWFKRNGIKFWALFLEELAKGTPVATVPAGTTKEQREEFLGLLSGMMNGGRICIPKGIDLKLLEAARDSGGDYDKFCARMDGVIAQIILTQTMTTADGASLSQAQVHERAAIALSKTDSDLLTESWMRGPVEWLTEWNFPGAKTPIVYRDFNQAEDLKARIERDNLLNTIGYRPTPDYIRETYGDGYEFVGAPQAPALGGVPAFSEGRVRDASAAVEDLVANEGWRRVLGPEVDALDELLVDAGSLDEVRARLDSLALREPSKLVEGLARVMFAARVQGGAGAEPTPEETARDEFAAAQRAVIGGGGR